MADETDSTSLRQRRTAQIHASYRIWRDERFPQPTSLTTFQHQVLLGGMFGDGCILWRKDCLHPNYTETHCAAQGDYVRWKARQLAALHPRVHQGARGQLHLHTAPIELLRPYRAAFYPEGRKVVPSDLLAEVGPIALAVWCMDDGSTASGGKYGHRFSLSTEGFGNAGAQEQLAAHLLSGFGLNARVQRLSPSQWTGRPLSRLQFTRSQTVNLLRIIDPHVVAPFRAKWQLDDPETLAEPLTRKEIIVKANLARTTMIRAGKLRVGHHTGTIRVPD